MRVFTGTLIAAILAISFLPGCVRTVGYGYDYQDRPVGFYDPGYSPYNYNRNYHRGFEPYRQQRQAHPVVRRDVRDVRDGSRRTVHERD